MDDHEFLGNNQIMSDDDYGIIISADGRLKGVWMPIAADEAGEPIPESIVKLCVEYFGIDPNTEYNVSQTIH